MVLKHVFVAAEEGGSESQCNSVRLQDLHMQQQSGETIPEEEGGEGGSSSDERDPSPLPPSPPPLAESPAQWREVTVSGGD